ncbi:uncharacterized protein [Epargyreus clarus]|uniref:uncharacterized protein n=1 Tax=Epargyreus clarus TaxID=520877 RepID=UPI003C2E39A3
MAYHLLYIQVIVYCIFVQNSEHVTFERTIQATSLPYYKILMTLGYCKENVIFKEYKRWPTTKLNRIMDIYYNSNNDQIRVSRVEVVIIINNTNCLALSAFGVGRRDFAATIYFATNMVLISYVLTIYSCDKINEDIISNSTEDKSKIPFYIYKVFNDTVF